MCPPSVLGTLVLFSAMLRYKKNMKWLQEYIKLRKQAECSRACQRMISDVLTSHRAFTYRSFCPCSTALTVSPRKT